VGGNQRWCERRQCTSVAAVSVINAKPISAQAM
jgi:hypothetical protein